MGWESRRNGCYYYAKTRHGARVESTYLGRGPLALAAAAMIEDAKAERMMEREIERAAIAEMRAEDAAFDRIDARVMDLTRAHLIESGFHEVKRVWRKRRCHKS